jgi:[acyl-carrier-protein] S-malonyltransferase
MNKLSSNNSKLAFVFPGQGSQSVGMLDEFAIDHESIVNATTEEAADVLGYDIATLIAHDPLQQLDQTEFTQPAVLTAGIIGWRIWQSECTEQPAFLAGHSLGEYTALVCSGAMSFAEALRLVAKRGELMQAAVAPGIGAMAAILGLDLAVVNSICATIGDVAAANINAPGQIVIAGTAKAVDIAIEQAKTVGAKRAIMLSVSVPSHCQLMRPAAEQLASYLAAVKWQQPTIPVVHNYDVASHTDAIGICNALQHQLYSPVRWIETIEYFVQQEVKEIIECGPGKVLTGLNKRIAPTLNLRAITESLGAGLC